MHLDGFTLVAQMINFLILVYLLKRFLYRPILDAMDRREAAIRDRLGQAEQREQEADAARERYQREQQTLAGQRQQVLDAARSEAERLRDERLAEARREIEQARQRWQEELAREQRSFREQVEQRLCDGVCRVSRRLLADLAERSLEQDIVRVFLRRLEELTEAERRSLAARSEVTFATAFSLDPGQRHTVTEALARYAIPAPRFVERPGLIAGLVLEADGHQVAWSVTDYLDDLAEQVLEPPENGRG